MSGDSIVPIISILPRSFGMSEETESSAEEFLSRTHRAFILAYIEQAQAREEAAISQLLG